MQEYEDNTDQITDQKEKRGGKKSSRMEESSKDVK